MRLCKAALAAAGLAVVFCAPPASAWHVIVPIVTPHGSGGAAAVGGGSAASGAAIVGGGIVVVSAAIIWCANHQPKRNMKRDTWVDGRHDVNPTSHPRKDGCLFKSKRDPNLVRVRG